jgi:hypothetical protein
VFHCCDKYDLREERFILAYSFRGFCSLWLGRLVGAGHILAGEREREREREK